MINKNAWNVYIVCNCACATLCTKFVIRIFRCAPHPSSQHNHPYLQQPIKSFYIFYMELKKKSMPNINKQKRALPSNRSKLKLLSAVTVQIQINNAKV